MFACLKIKWVMFHYRCQIPVDHPKYVDIFYVHLYADIYVNKYIITLRFQYWCKKKTNLCIRKENFYAKYIMHVS